ncbi:mast cell protease 1-like [Cimex lectularius]|uniref:Peptidase S1 domain-containing protein n=1 Tax=Cimex lectularius TaxID=79782 RepID=A0A8I6RHB4_CIMLE|nr:mast cell protease 1-like [Cimex lectularius]
MIMIICFPLIFWIGHGHQQFNSRAVMRISLIFLFISECCLLASEDNKQLIGGRDVLPGEFPATVCVGGVRRCGGTLISLDMVFSVAHCFLDHGERVHPNTFTILGGVVNISEESGEEQRSYVRDYIIHENFEVKRNEFGYYTIFDVAVAYLESPFVQTPTVECANFPAQNALGMQHVLQFIMTTGDTCVSVGYGLLSMTGVDVVSETLRMIDLRLLPKNECFVEETMYNSEICATSIKEDDKTAPGDTGTTFMCGGYIIGMTKSGTTHYINGKQFTLLVFTLIGPYIEYFDLDLLTEGAAYIQMHPVIISLLALQMALLFVKMVHSLFG